MYIYTRASIDLIDVAMTYTQIVHQAYLRYVGSRFIAIINPQRTFISITAVANFCSLDRTKYKSQSQRHSQTRLSSPDNSPSPAAHFGGASESWPVGQQQPRVPQSLCRAWISMSPARRGETT